MSINPYQAPTAATADIATQADADGYTGEIARLPAGDGVVWISDGWEMFKAAPGTWIGIALVFAVLALGTSLVPLIGSFGWNILMPIFVGGMMLACDAARRGEAPTFGHLFEGFNRQAGQLALVGVIYLAGVLVLVLGAGILTAIGLSAFAFDLEGAFSGGGDATAVLIAILFLLVVLAVTVPLVMSVWFAPALVILHDVPAFEAMKRSFQGCLANILPFLVYGLVSLLLSIVATLPLMLGWLVVGPIFIGSAYSGYRRIYCNA
jgi:uncharacterized membrane protein